MIRLKSATEIDAIARAGAIVGEVLKLASQRAAPGVTTAELDREAEAVIASQKGAAPAFKGLYGFPATLCTSINEEVVHGIPSEQRVLRPGDILSVDVGVVLDGFYADAAVTVPIGEVGPQVCELLQTTRQALEVGIDHARSGNRLGDLGSAIQKTVEAVGFSVIRELVGHGVGEAAHEEPQVPNYGRVGRGTRIQEGLVIAIEPMVNVGNRSIRTLEDGWTVVTADRSLSAHYEHTVAVTADGPRVLTALPETTTKGEA